MLYLTRKIGETVIINNNIEITVVGIKGGNVKLGCSFPAEASVLRKEIHDKIINENLSASTKGADSESLSALMNIKLK
jgi:carbon storage regulator